MEPILREALNTTIEVDRSVLITPPVIARMFILSSRKLEEKKKLLDDINVYPVKDADTGTNMHATLAEVHYEINTRNPKTMRELSEAICDSTLLNASGNSGIILSQYIEGFFEQVKDKDQIDSLALTQAMARGAYKAYHALDKPKEGTILTVMKGAAMGALEAVKKREDPKGVLRRAYSIAYRELLRTREILPKLREAGVVDSGGLGFLYMLEAWLEALGERVDTPIRITEIGETSSIEYGEYQDEKYCVQFLVEGEVDREQLLSRLSEIGSCAHVVGRGSKYKVHVHTDHPHLAREACQCYGEIKNEKIQDMEEDYKKSAGDQ